MCMHISHTHLTRYMYHTIRYDTIRHDTMRCDTIRYDVNRYQFHCHLLRILLWHKHSDESATVIRDDERDDAFAGSCIWHAHADVSSVIESCGCGCGHACRRAVLARKKATRRVLPAYRYNRRHSHGGHYLPALTLQLCLRKSHERRSGRSCSKRLRDLYPRDEVAHIRATREVTGHGRHRNESRRTRGSLKEGLQYRYLKNSNFLILR